MKNDKKCEMTSECWSGFAKVLGIAFIIVATILTLITMNGLGILGMFIVGAILCRKKCPCCCGPHHDHHHAHHDVCCPEEKPKAKPKKTVAKS